jgi:hypothetical protein
MNKAKGTISMLQLNIILRESDPLIWRRVLVPADHHLGHLHFVIQMAMGWTNSHLHQFKISGIKYASPNYEELPNNVKNEKMYKLSALLNDGSSFQYDYDFGDGWRHDIVVEKVLPQGKKDACPVCLAGENACPPDDCGGIDGYYELLKIIKDPKHPEYEEKSVWLGEFDPAGFNIKEVNAALKDFSKDPDADWRVGT